MQTPIGAKDKRRFIKWFLHNYQLKRRESVWILHYIINHHTLLANVHFVREINACPRGIVISSNDSEDVPFRFYKEQLMTTDPEKAFHDIRMNQSEPLYIQLNFRNAHQNACFAAVLVENPFFSKDHSITSQDQRRARQLLEKVINDYKRKTIQENINRALDKRDKERFHYFAKQLVQFEQTYYL